MAKPASALCRDAIKISLLRSGRVLRRSKTPFETTVDPKRGAPWRRVVRTVRVAEKQFYDELDCGHRETHDVLSKKRRCRTCADPTFPGIAIEPRNPLPPVVPVEESAVGAAPTSVPSGSSDPIPLVLTVEAVAKILRVNRKTLSGIAKGM